MLIGVRQNSFAEWAIPEWMRSRWLHEGGRVLREEPGEVGEPTLLELLAKRRQQEVASSAAIAPPAETKEPEPEAPRKGAGRPAGSKTRRGQEGGEREIRERLKG